MKSLQSLFLVALALSIAQARHERSWRSIAQFRAMMLCVMPDSWPIFDYADYGCYCGKGGSGTPVDGLDRCCMVHDACYGAAIEHPECWYILDDPFIAHYHWECDYDDRQASCLSKNDECAMFVCECDRMASECFGRNPWNPANEHLPADRCV